MQRVYRAPMGCAELHLPAEARDVYDVTDAGDTVFFTLAAGKPFSSAVATLAGGVVVDNIRPSMSGKGACWDNATVERFFGSLKRERTDHVLYPTRQAAKADVIDYIEM